MLMSSSFSGTSFRYLFFELIPSFILGILIFTFIILMFQGLKLAEFALIHGVGLSTLLEILFYMTISLLPALLPMSLLFSVVLTYSRLSGDSEIIALKSSGVSVFQLVLPPLILGILTCAGAAQVSFEMAPWGNRKFEILISKLGNVKAAINLKEGTFMEGFFDMVVYASKINPTTGELHHIFIYDERQNPPLTIIAKDGLMNQSAQMTGQQVELELLNGDIHRKTETHTKIKFGKFFITLNESYQLEEKDKTLQSMTLDELKKLQAAPLNNEKSTTESKEAKAARAFEIEYHRRIAIAFTSLIFAILGSTLGLNHQRRSGRGSGLVLALSVIVVYWILFVLVENFAKNSHHYVPLILWIPNILFLTTTAWFLRKQSRPT